jgi:hypothetical protein
MYETAAVAVAYQYSAYECDVHKSTVQRTHLSSASVNLSHFDDRQLITSQMSPLFATIQPQLDASGAHRATHDGEQQQQQQQQEQDLYVLTSQSASTTPA